MAKIYLEKLTILFQKLNIEDEIKSSCEIKHFFSGAALYVNKTIRVSWSPAGLAFKLPEQDAEKLINAGKAIPLKYFAKGHVKKGYALFENPEDKKQNFGKNIF